MAATLEELETILDSELSAVLLKEYIQKKYRSMSRCARVLNVKRHTITTVLDRSTPESSRKMQELWKTVKRTPDRSIRGMDMTAELRWAIRTAVGGGPKSKFPTTDEFCKQHPSFHKTWVSRVIHGYYLNITPRIKDLCNTLEVKIPC